MVTLYTIYADDTPIYLPPDLQGSNYSPENVTPTSGKLTLEDNKSGMLTFSILPDNLAYDKIMLITTTIKIYEHIYGDDGNETSSKIIWMGRPISIEEDMEHIRSYFCEGALAYLNDIVCYPLDATITSEVVVPDEENGIVTTKQMQNEAIKRALQTFLDTGGNTDPNTGNSGSLFRQSNVSTIDFKDCIYTVGRGYNSECPPNRKIKIGNVTIANMSGISGLVDATSGTDPMYSPSDYPNGAWYFEMTLSTPDIAFASALDQILYITTETNGGHLVMRYEIEDNDVVMYLDYLSDYTLTNSSAEYGVNIIDYSGSLEMNSPVTDIIPRGAVISTWTDDNAIADDITNVDHTYNIGDTVSFKGTRHYVASTSDVGYPCTPGSAQITNIALGTIHPYHLIHNDDTSTVYGWVNQTDIETGYYSPSAETSVEFTRRSYDSMPSTEYIGIRDGYKYGNHLVNEELMAKYGRIQQIVDFPDIKDPDELKTAGEEWLRTHSSFLRQSYEISMIDLGRLYGEDLQPIHLLDLVHVSIPGYVDEHMPITKIDLDLTNPANTTFQFSKTEEMSAVSKSKRRKARAVTSDSTLSVQLNGPGDSLTESMARNNRYLSKLDNHTDINTSVSRNTKNTFPGGRSGNFDLITDTWIDNAGNTHYETQNLTFVNGLLCSNNGRSMGPEINFFRDVLLSSMTKPVIKPVNKYAMLGVSSLRFDSSNSLSTGSLFGSSLPGNGWHFNSLAWVGLNDDDTLAGIDVFPLPVKKRDSDDAYDVYELMLETDTNSGAYGLYYFYYSDGNDDHKKAYWPSPYIYFLPTTDAKHLYIFYARPKSQKEIDNTTSGAGYVIYTQKIANLGNYSTRGYANYDFQDIFKKMCAPALENQLKKLARSYQPNNSYVKDLVELIINYAPSCPPPMTALLIMPFSSIWQNIVRGLYVSPAIVMPSSEYQYVNGNPYPKTMKIYPSNGTRFYPVSYRTGSVVYPQRDLMGGGSSDETTTITTTMADMALGFRGYHESEIATEVKNIECYVFTSQEDLDAIVEDYKIGGFSQSAIYQKHKDKMISINNTDKNILLQYYFNGIKTSYNVEGSNFDTLWPG